MSTSSHGGAAQEQPSEAIVWVWLPDATKPVPAGRVDQVGESLVFRYGNRYLERENRIALYEPELPLRSGEHVPQGRVHGCLLDAGPDSWGQRVILHRRFGRGAADTSDLRPLTYLAAAGSDRIGALDFQASATEYVPRKAESASLDELVEAAQRVQDGVALTPALAEALLRGTSIGGARPKALLDDGGRRLIAKLGSTTEGGRSVRRAGRACPSTPSARRSRHRARRASRGAWRRTRPGRPRSGEAEQVMAIGDDGWRYSQVAGCVARAATYHLSRDEAQAIVDGQRSAIETHWTDVCDAARLTQAQRSDFWGKQFLNPFALQASHTQALRGT